jgi:hypothetical protein
VIADTGEDRTTFFLEEDRRTGVLLLADARKPCMFILFCAWSIIFSCRVLNKINGVSKV